MRTREGVSENKAFGPAQPPETQWVIELRDGTRKHGVGATAWVACASVGVAMGDVLHINRWL